MGKATGKWDVSTPEKREAAIRRYVYIVKYVVGRVCQHLPSNVDREDLVSAGIVGLIKAVDRFDPARGAKFETYATTVVRGEVMESLRAKDWAPRSLRRKLRKLAEKTSELEQRFLRPPTEEEIASEMGMSVGEYHRFLSSGTSASVVASLEEVLVGEEPETVELNPVGMACWQFTDPAVLMENAVLRQMVAAAVNELPDRERSVIRMYYDDDGLTLKEIGGQMGFTESRACQLCTRALHRLRHSLQRELWA